MQKLTGKMFLILEIGKEYKKIYKGQKIHFRVLKQWTEKLFLIELLEIFPCLNKAEKVKTGLKFTKVYEKGEKYFVNVIDIE